MPSEPTALSALESANPYYNSSGETCTSTSDSTTCDYGSYTNKSSYYGKYLIIDDYSHNYDTDYCNGNIGSGSTTYNVLIPPGQEITPAYTVETIYLAAGEPCEYIYNYYYDSIDNVFSG